MLYRLFAVIAVCLFWGSYSACGAEKPRRVLYINSYCISMPFSHDIMSGFQKYLARNNIPANIDYRELDVCGTPGMKVAPYRIAAIQSVLDTQYFDIIITNGNEAAHLFTGHKLKIRKKRTSLIIVNFYDSLLQSTPTGLPTTGVLAIYPPYSVVQMGLELKPDTEKVVIVTGATDDSREFLKRLKNNQLAAPRKNIEIISGLDYSHREMMDKLKALPEKSIVAFHSWSSLKNSNDGTVDFAEDLSKKTRALILGSQDRHRHYGAAGGMLVSGTDFGEKAGEIAMRIFKGEDASSIPFAHINPRPVLNYSALKKYGIDKKNLSGSITLLDAPRNIFTDYWLEILIISFAVLLLLQLALMQIYYYRRMINQLKGLMAKMPMQITLTDAHGKVLFSNIPEEERDVLHTVSNLSELGDAGDLALQKLAELDNSKAERIRFEHEEGGRHYHTTLCRLNNDRLFHTRAFLGVTNNITERKNGEIRYHNSMKMLNTIMENLPGVLFVKNVDDDFRYVAVNNNFVELLQCPREKAEGRTDYELFADFPEQAERFRQDDWDTVQSEFLDKIETVSYCGNAHTMRTIKTIVRQKGGSRLLIGMSIDISERAKLAEEREEIIENLNQLIAWEQLTNYILLGTISLQGGEFDSVVSRNLSRIGEATGTEHVYIFRYTSPERSHAFLEYGWDRATGKVERNIDDVKLDFSLLKDTGNELAAHGECYYTVEPYPDGKWAAEQETMKRFPDLYARHFAEITVDGKPYGFFGMDYSRGKYSPERFSTLIRTLAQLYQIDCERELKIRQLHESRDFMRQLIEKIDIPLTLCDENYNLVMINEKARKNARPEFDSEWKNRKSGEKIKCYHASACGDGKGNPSDFCPVKHCLATGQSCSIPHEWQGNHLISSGQFLHDRIHDRRYILVADVDITQRVKNEQQLKEALEAAKTAERAKSAFLATMSHEIRTPLNAIIGFSDILNSAELPPDEQRENIQAIHFAGNALLSLINDILDLSRLEAGQMALVIQKCDFAGLLHGISAIFQMKIRDKKLQYREAIPDNLPIVAVDSLRIKQILLNLIGNAVKFTAYGRISVTVEFTPETRESGTLKISVADTGCGVAPEYRERIFQPFFQQDIIRDSHAYNGTGLGLPISKRLAERMGGELYLEKTGEHGSVFVLEIPEVKYFASASITAEPKPEDDSIFTGRNILIVDDVLLNLKVLGSMLRKSGMHPIEASSAAEALKLLEDGTAVDLVLTDLWMPGMNGAEFAEAVHRIPSCAGLRVIALTADVEMAQNFSQEHFSGHILKPVTIAKLRQVLRG